MRNKVAKKLRREAEAATVGQSARVTRRTYRKFKAIHKKEKRGY